MTNVVKQASGPQRPILQMLYHRKLLCNHSTYWRVLISAAMDVNRYDHGAFKSLATNVPMEVTPIYSSLRLVWPVWGFFSQASL